MASKKAKQNILLYKNCAFSTPGHIYTWFYILWCDYLEKFIKYFASYSLLRMLVAYKWKFWALFYTANMHADAQWTRGGKGDPGAGIGSFII